MTWSDGTFSGAPDPCLQPQVSEAVDIRFYPSSWRPRELGVSVGREILRHGTRTRHFVIKGKFPVDDTAAAAECARHWAAETGFPINDVAGVLSGEGDD